MLLGDVIMDGAVPATRELIDICEATGAGAIQYMSVNTPVEMSATPENQCGRFIHTDLHVAGNSTSSSDQGTPFPGGCDKGELTPEEKALAFMIFDLSNCVMEEKATPKPPVIVK